MLPERLQLFRLLGTFRPGGSSAEKLDRSPLEARGRKSHLAYNYFDIDVV